MKWSVNQVAELHDLCMAEKSNAELAEHFGVPVTEIHAKRSQLGITIPKVAAMKDKPALTVDPVFEAAVQEMDERASDISKETFIGLLELLLGHANCDVHSLRLTDPETITVRFENGYSKRVCIAADSRLAIIKDVCRALS